MFTSIGGARMREGAHMDATWPSGATVSFRGLIRADTVHEYQGFQFTQVTFEELTHFEESQFWYLWTRCRNAEAGLPRPYMRATVNPDATSWVRKLVDWYIGPTGHALPERSGVLRWLARRGDDTLQFDTQVEAQAFCSALPSVNGRRPSPISFTFISAQLNDNLELLKNDPTYGDRIAMQDAVTRARLLDGNWDAVHGGGAVFKREWFDTWDEIPTAQKIYQSSRGWDFAGTAPTPQYPDPDWTRGVRLDYLRSGKLVVSDVASCRDTEGGIDELVIATVKADGPGVTQCLWQDPASAGKAYASRMVALIHRALPSCHVDVIVQSKDKLTYAQPWSAFLDPRTCDGIRRGVILNRAWTLGYLAELEAFPGKGAKKDQVDATSRAWGVLDPASPDFATEFLRNMARVRV